MGWEAGQTKRINPKLSTNINMTIEMNSLKFVICVLLYNKNECVGSKMSVRCQKNMSKGLENCARYRKTV